MSDKTREERPCKDPKVSYTLAQCHRGDPSLYVRVGEGPRTVLYRDPSSYVPCNTLGSADEKNRRSVTRSDILPIL